MMWYDTDSRSVNPARSDYLLGEVRCLLLDHRRRNHGRGAQGPAVEAVGVSERGALPAGLNVGKHPRDGRGGAFVIRAAGKPLAISRRRSREGSLQVPHRRSNRQSRRASAPVVSKAPPRCGGVSDKPPSYKHRERVESRRVATVAKLSYYIFCTVCLSESKGAHLQYQIM